MGERQLSGSVVAVVGAGGGLGSAISAVLADAGASVVLVGRTPGPLQAVAAQHPGLTGAVQVVCDVRDPGAGDLVRRAIDDGPGRLDGLVVASGVVAFGDLVDTADDTIEELFLTNVMGPLWLIRRLVPLLADSAGFVANLSAVVAEAPVPSMAAYSASKAALTAADVALARELRRRGIAVCDLRPPHTETGLAGRPIAGSAPRLPQGLDPQSVAATVVAAIVAGDREVPASRFGA
jgi:short-subunit dehydrogenase